jgi:predicted DCC family thiol-disulfide oxidoreductase YuxK
VHEQWTVLYDADCGFCRWSLAKILKRDRSKRLRPIPLQSAEANDLLPGMSDEDRRASWHLVAPDGRIWSAGAAAAPMARLLPKGAPVAFLAETFPRLTERVYRWVANNRDRLGKRLGEDACAVDPSRSRS